MAYQFLEPEYNDLYSAWKKAPGPETVEPLLTAVNPVIDTALRTYGGANPSPVVKTKAKLLALQAFNNYDPDRAKLRTHLISHLRGLHRIAAKSNQIIGLPERVALDLGRVRDAEKELKDTYGRDPSVAELADFTGINQRRIGKLSKVSPGLTEGQTISETDEGEDELSPGVVNPASQETWLNFVYHDLHPVDQVIFEHTLGYNGKRKLPKNQIAKKIGLSPGALSQRLARIQQKLDTKDISGGLFQ